MNKSKKTILESEFLISEFAEKIPSSNEQIIKLRMKEKYGNGRILIYEIFKNIFLFYSEYDSFKSFVEEDGVFYKFPVICIEHFILGEMTVVLKNRETISVKEGETLFFSGSNSLIEAYSESKNLKALTLFCYNDDIPYLSSEFDVSEVELTYFFNSLSKRKNFLTTKTDSRSCLLIKELLTYIKVQNMTMIKLRGIELFINAIVDFPKYEDSVQKKYNRDLLFKVIEIKRFIEKNWKKNYTIDHIAREFGISKTYIKDIFKYLYGEGLASFSRKYRIEKAKEMIKTTDKTIIEIANIVGYSNPSKFSKAFKNQFGMLPVKYRKEVKKI